MQSIQPEQVTPQLRALLRTDEPQARRCFAVLEGNNPRGEIFCDDPSNPTWAVVKESTDNSLYFGGEINAEIIAAIFAKLRQQGDILVGLWLDDPHIDLLPPNPDYDGRTLEFYERPIGQGLAQYVNAIPEDCQIHRLDRELIMRTEWGPNDVASWGSLDAWEQHCFGYCLMRGDELLSEASVGPSALGRCEPGLITQAAHRGHGYGTMVVARLIQEIESRGYITYWNCSKRNVASAAVARKLGYRIEKEYRCMVWNQTT